MPDQDKFNEWCILELMGHRRLYGRVTEQELGGTNMLRVDVFGEKPEGLLDIQTGPALATQFYSAAAVYCITPTTEEICRRMGERNRPEPVTKWDLRPAIEDRTGNGTDDVVETDEDGLPF